MEPKYMCLQTKLMCLQADFSLTCHRRTWVVVVDMFLCRTINYTHLLWTITYHIFWQGVLVYDIFLKNIINSNSYYFPSFFQIPICYLHHPQSNTQLSLSLYLSARLLHFGNPCIPKGVTPPRMYRHYTYAQHLTVRVFKVKIEKGNGECVKATTTRP